MVGGLLASPVHPPARGTRHKWGLCSPTPRSVLGLVAGNPLPVAVWPQGKHSSRAMASDLATFSQFLCPQGPPCLVPGSSIPWSPSAWLYWGLGEQEGGGGSPHGSFKKPTTGSRNQLKVTAGTCGLGSSERGRRDGGRRKAARGQNEITAGERGRLAAEWSGKVGCRGVPPMGAPRDRCGPNPGAEPCALLGAI